MEIYYLKVAFPGVCFYGSNSLIGHTKYSLWKHDVYYNWGNSLISQPNQAFGKKVHENKPKIP